LEQTGRDNQRHHVTVNHHNKNRGQTFRERKFRIKLHIRVDFEIFLMGLLASFGGVKTESGVVKPHKAGGEEPHDSGDQKRDNTYVGGHDHTDSFLIEPGEREFVELTRNVKVETRE
jgi:hypothetical protein